MESPTIGLCRHVPSTYDVAASTDIVIPVSLNGTLALAFLTVFFFSLVQIVQLWLEGSKLSNRKRVFIRIMICVFGTYLLDLSRYLLDHAIDHLVWEIGGCNHTIPRSMILDDPLNAMVSFADTRTHES